LSIDPNYVDAWNQKGLSLDALGKYKEAIECFNKVLSIDPNNDIAIKNKTHALDEVQSYPAQLKQEGQQQKEDQSLQLLKSLQGDRIEEFNRKRKEEKYGPIFFEKIDLSNKNLSGADLHDIKFSGSRLVNVKLGMANLTQA
jgi:tetratricopeptide (TPR) repeat protein